MKRNPLIFMGAALLALVVMTAIKAPVEAQGGLVVVTSAAQVTGTGAAVQLASSGTARWIQVLAPTTNSATVNCGDSSVSTTRGILIAAGGGFMFPQIAPDERQAVNQRYYSLSTTYCYVANGDKMNVIWGN